MNIRYELFNANGGGTSWRATPSWIIKRNTFKWAGLKEEILFKNAKGKCDAHSPEHFDAIPSDTFNSTRPYTIKSRI